MKPMFESIVLWHVLSITVTSICSASRSVRSVRKPWIVTLRSGLRCRWIHLWFQVVKLDIKHKDPRMIDTADKFISKSVILSSKVYREKSVGWGESIDFNLTI
jgi:hypothetical protein